METKICTKCKSEKDVEDFGIQRKRNGRRACCKICCSKKRAKKIEVTPDIVGESWINVSLDDFEKYYVISTKARVKRILRKIHPCNYLVTQHERSGYKYVTLQASRKKNMFVHRLVALAFIPNPLNLPEVNHIDGNKLNNNVENLEWCTRSGNAKHAWDNNLCVSKNGEENHFSKLTKKQVLEVRVIGKSKPYSETAKTYNVSKDTIYDIVNRKTWKHI